jgi:membrane fusion protein, heavy metal efflux system
MKAFLLQAALFAALAACHPAHAGPGHDHGDAPPAASGNGPKRQPDGSVFLPKPTQRQLGVRTLVVAAAALPKSTELAATVVMDPRAGGRVQALVAGRIEAGPRGLPGIGQRVQQGELLAYVVPSAGAIERSNQLAQLAELRAAKTVADQRIARLKELADTVPRKDIEAAEAEGQGLAGRIAALGAGLNSRDALRSPVSGVIASSHALAGQVVDARELVYEVVDPTRLRIEALAYDGAVAADIAGASLAIGTQQVALRFAGAARSLRDQALPLQFTGSSPALAQLAVGQPVRVVVQSKTRIQGFALPVAALMKNPANQTIVWVKKAPENFEPRVVTVEPLDGTTVAVTSGLAAGDRVATQGAALINQVR